MDAISSVEMIGRLGLAAFLGYLIGLERALAGQAAGERTHSLAAVGAATFGLISVAGWPGADPTRVASGVVTGLGFLGAGMILKSAGEEIRGLTTAAGIWAVGGSGLAIGMGLYLLGIGATVVVGLLLLTERVTKIDERVARRRATQSQQIPETRQHAMERQEPGDRISRSHETG
jgi:putative Mg2+ transporter-C (MgtC) family protein